METNTPSQSDQQTIIAQLQEQNRTLHQLLEFHLQERKAARRRAIESFILHAIPYIAIIIVGYFLYMSIQHYLDAINNNINALHDGFSSIKNSIGKLIPDFTGIKDNLNNAWQNTKDIFQ